MPKPIEITLDKVIDYCNENNCGFRDPAGGSPIPNPWRKVLLFVGGRAWLFEKGERIPKKLQTVIADEYDEIQDFIEATNPYGHS